MIGAKIAIKNGETLPKTSYKSLKSRTLLLLYPLLILIILLIIASIADLINGNSIGVLSLLPLVVGYTAGTLFKKNKNKKRRSKDKNIVLFIILVIVTVIGVNVIMPKLLHISESEELKEGYKGLRLSDFELPSPDYTNFFKEGSIILPKRSTYYEISRGQNRYYISTEYIKAINNSIARYVFDGMIEESVSKYNRTVTPAGIDYDYFDEAFFMDYPNNDRSVILLKDNEIFHIDSSLELSNKDTIAIITNKLNNQ